MGGEPFSGGLNYPLKRHIILLIHTLYFHHRNSEEKEKKAKVCMSHDPGDCHITITCTTGRRRGEGEAAQRVPGEREGDEGTHTTITNTNPAGKCVNVIDAPLTSFYHSNLTSGINLP